MANELARVKYKSLLGKDISLTPEIIKSYFVSGGGEVTDTEMLMFFKLCEHQQLDPWLKEAYLIKYGEYPAAIVTAKEAFLKRAKRNKDYKGHSVGISDDGQIAWAEVYVKDFEKPIKVEVEYDEYVQLKNGQPNKMWGSKPKTMLKKVALVQALREAFPQDLGSLYEPSEKDPENDSELIEADVTVTTVKKAESKSETKIENPKKQEDSKPQGVVSDEIMIKVKKVSEKHSEPDSKKKWTKYGILSVGGTMYSSFSDTVGKDARTIEGKDKEALVLYQTIEKDGHTYHNILDQEGSFVIID